MNSKLCQDDWRNNTYTGEINYTTDGKRCMKWNEVKTKLLKKWAQFF